MCFSNCIVVIVHLQQSISDVTDHLKLNPVVPNLLVYNLNSKSDF